MIRTYDELMARAAVCKEILDSKFNGSDGKTYLMICGGGGCVASGALKLEEECNRLIAEKGLADKVAVRKVGCFGLCSQGPFIRVYPKDVLYRLVKPEDIEEIFEKAIRAFNGRAIYDGSCDLSDACIQRCVDQYGLIIL